MLETFKKAFRANHSGFSGECVCGREFFHPDHASWDFEDREIEYLESENATMLDHAVDYVEIDGTDYVLECDCWHKKAERLMYFLNRYDVQVAKYLNGERARKIYEAEQMQIINILRDSDLPNHKEEYDDDIPF